MQKRTEQILGMYAEQTPQENIEQQIQSIDDWARRRASTKAIILGVIGTLLLGIGMCFTMVFTEFFVLGIVVGIVGLALAAVAYPLYTRTLASERVAVRPEVMRLASELSNG